MWALSSRAVRKLKNAAKRAVAFVARWLPDSHKFHDVAQGALAVVGIVAIGVGGWLYVVERRDKPRVILEPRTTVVGITRKDRREGRLDAVLVQVAISIENRSSRPHTFNCPAIDLIGLSGVEERQATYVDDLDGPSLLPANKTSPNWLTCVKGFEKRRRVQEQDWYDEQVGSDEWVNPPRPSSEATSGARYRDFFMEPGELATKTWEQRVPCTYDAVRVIFKLPKPHSVHDYETKILVPIADVCANERNVSILRYAPVAPGAEEDETTGGESASEGSAGPTTVQ